MRTDWDYLWKLALRRKVAGDVRIVRSVIADVGEPLMGIKHKHLLSFSPNEIKWCNEVRITTDESNGVYVVRKNIVKHVSRDVDIRPFLLQLYNANFSVRCFLAVSTLGAYGRHPNLISIVVSLNYLKALDFRNCPQIDSLALDSLGIIWKCTDTCGIEFDRSDSMVAFDQCACERKRVKPFDTWIVAEESIIEIPCVNINVCLHFIKMLRLRPFWIGASPRVGRASRSDVNLLTGSIGIVPNLTAGRKRAKFQIMKTG